MEGGAGGARRIDHSSVSTIPKSKKAGIGCRWEQKSGPYHVVQLQKSSDFLLKARERLHQNDVWSAMLQNAYFFQPST